jgi:Bacterial protein of unknown function (DUF899)
MGSLPEVVSTAEWLTARKELLANEKELTRLRDRVNADRRRLPMVRVDKAYVFEGPNGTVSLIDPFRWRPQLVMHDVRPGPERRVLELRLRRRHHRQSEATARHPHQRQGGDAIGMTLIGAGMLWAIRVPGRGHVLGQPRRALHRRRRRHSVLLHSDLGRRADRRARAPVRACLRAAEQFHPAGRRDRNRDRVEGGRQRHRAPRRARETVSAALTDGFHQTFGVAATIALIASLSTVALVRRTRPSTAIATTATAPAHLCDRRHQLTK